MDRARARELQWLFTNRQIAARTGQHMQEVALEFAAALGLPPQPPDWSLPLPAAAREWARAQIPDGARSLVVSPCSSHPARNWRVERYAAVIAHAVRECGMQVILCTSPDPAETAIAAAIERSCGVPVTNLAGRDTLPQLLALLGRATVLLTPDSGPAHMGTLAGMPVIGLYACTRSARTGPYRSREYCVDRYAEAARRFRHCEPEALGWTEDIQGAGCHGSDRGGRRDRTARGRAGRPLAMKELLAPVSPGELLDKITILRIKAARIDDAAKLANVRHELALLEQTWERAIAADAASRPRSALWKR